MKVISSWIAGGFGLLTAIIAFIGFALSKGYFTEKFEKLPSDPAIYFVILIILGIILIVISFSSRKYF